MKYTVLKATDHGGNLVTKLVHSQTFEDEGGDATAFFVTHNFQRGTIQKVGEVDITGDTTLLDEIYESDN